MPFEFFGLFVCLCFQQFQEGGGVLYSEERLFFYLLILFKSISLQMYTIHKKHTLCVFIYRIMLLFYKYYYLVVIITLLYD